MPNYNLLLIQQCEQNNVPEVKSIIKRHKYKIDINYMHKSRTALMEACSSNNLELIKVLLDAGADPNVQNDKGQTALTHNSNFIYSYTLEKLLIAGADPNIKDNIGQTVLMNMVSQGALSSVEILLKAGADPNTQNDKGQTALIIACLQGFKNCAQLLLDAGADPNIQDNKGQTAFMSLIQTNNGIRNFGSVSNSLIKSGASIFLKNKKNQDILKVIDDNSYDWSPYNVRFYAGSTIDFLNNLSLMTMLIIKSKEIKSKTGTGLDGYLIRKIIERVREL
jgi:ankyrin repeat protein